MRGVSNIIIRNTFSREKEDADQVQMDEEGEYCITESVSDPHYKYSVIAKSQKSRNAPIPDGGFSSGWAQRACAIQATTQTLSCEIGVSWHLDLTILSSWLGCAPGPTCWKPT